MEEIERRGMEEVGIYRVSGVATDIQSLKAAFDASEFPTFSVSPGLTREGADVSLLQTTRTCPC